MSHGHHIAGETTSAGRGFGAANGVRGRVLVVEDDGDIRETLRDVLTWGEYEVVTASNGREALDLLRDGTDVDVILLDLMMPVMSGWEFRRVQLDDPALAGIPCVVLSASAPGQARPDRFLAKPVGVDELLFTVGDVLAGHEAAAAA